MCKTLLICWFSLVTFFASLKISIYVCHFGVDLLIWPGNSIQRKCRNYTICANPVDSLIRLGNFLDPWKFQYMSVILMLICWYGLVTLSRENIEIILYVQNPVDLLIWLGNFFCKSENFNICVSFWCIFVGMASKSIRRK